MLMSWQPANSAKLLTPPVPRSMARDGTEP